MTLIEQISKGLHDEGSFKRMFKPKDMKLFPFESFQSFSQQNDKGEENPHLHCSYCGVDLTQSGNGEYYTGYIVFESEKEVKLSCRHSCLPKGCLSFYDQQFGFREPLRLPEKFKESLPHIVVFENALSGKLFEYNKYRQTGIKLSDLSDYFSTFGGGANGKYQHQFKKGKLFISVKWELKHELTKAQILKIANEIIMQQDEPQTTVKPAKLTDNGILKLTEPGLIKVCIDPTCETIYFRIPKAVKRCECGMLLVEINKQTYTKKFVNVPYQFDYESGKHCRLYETEKIIKKQGPATAEEIQTAVDNFNKPREASREQKAKQAQRENKKQLSYPGGKNGAGTYQEIICQFPPHKRYIELFLGSGAIINRKKPALENYGVELNRSTIDKFTYTSAATIVHADVYTWLKENRHLIDKNTLIYLDPPYPLESIKSQLPLYEKHLSDDQHHELLKILVELPCMIVISSYENQIYNSYLSNWRKHFYQNTTRQGLATECLYMNYPEPTELHDYSFLGKNFTDRQRIKRKITREIKKLLALPTLECNAIISEIQDIKQ